MMRFICCAPGCGWQQQPDPMPAAHPRAGYTPYWRCPSCGTKDSIHYACEADGCWERATHIKTWGRLCNTHFQRDEG